MEQVFAPWRIEWVERTDSERDSGGCVFCTLPDRREDQETRIVARNAHAYVILNNYPYNPGHVMVIPYDHTGDYAALGEDTLAAHARLKQRTFRALREVYEPDGFNSGLNLGRGAGGSVSDHLHTHLVPRWSEDTNFMAVTAETKVIVEGLERAYGRLQEAFREQEGASEADSGAVSFA
jgi:ATP adenylyltransferase